MKKLKQLQQKLKNIIINTNNQIKLYNNNNNNYKKNSKNKQTYKQSIIK